MNTEPLTAEVESTIHAALLATWSERTHPGFYSLVPSYNQCKQTAVVLFERFGGEILRTEVTMCDGSQIEHYYNRINGHRYDFSVAQFEIPDFVKPIQYQDLPSSQPEAAHGLQPSQLTAMRTGFDYAYSAFKESE